jgi:alpha/beta superfamily hydrolase
MRRVFVFLLLLVVADSSFGQTNSSASLVEARGGFQTRLLRRESMGETAERPPSGVLQLTSYPAPLGRNAAYVSPPPKSGGKRPAIIWLVGGFSNSIGDFAWTPGPASNDQSAAGFRNAGIVMMYPSLRGGNDNPGHIETFLGEVDDVLAAAKFLAALDYVDPTRIYLGGHSTGGTLALLVAAASGDQFRAVFALGPIDDPANYGAEVLPFDLRNKKEIELRAPVRWLAGIRCPTIVLEGTKSRGNIDSLRTMEKRSRNPLVQFVPMPGHDHFSVIAPLVKELAQMITADSGTGRFRFERGRSTK